MEPDELARQRAQEEARLTAAEQDSPLPDAGSVTDGVLGLIDSAFSLIAAADLVSEVAGALPKVADAGMDVIGDIGEALGDVLDFDF